METSTILLSKLIAEAEIRLRNLNYSSKTIKRYKSVWNKVHSHHVASGLLDCEDNINPSIASRLVECNT